MSKYPDFLDPPKKSERWKWTMPLVAVGIIVAVIGVAMHRRHRVAAPRGGSLLERMAIPRFTATRYLMDGTAWKESEEEYFDDSRWRIDRTNGEILLKCRRSFTTGFLL